MTFPADFPYELIGEIGRGGMGVVLKARARDGRVVALKVLLHARRAQALLRFERERRLLAALGEDDGFVPLLDVGALPGGVGPPPQGGRPHGPWITIR